MSGLRIDHGTTSGTFSLDGETFDVENNVWVIGDDDECVVIDAPHSVEDILEVVGGRRGAGDRVYARTRRPRPTRARARRDGSQAPVLLHATTNRSGSSPIRTRHPDGWLVEGKPVAVAGSELEVLHTPGHSPGGVCLYSSDLGAVFTGDTLFKGGPGATGRSFSDYETLATSIRTKLFALPRDTVVHTGHGDSTTIGAELF